MAVEEIAAQTLVLDEHEFIAARLEEAAAREAQQAALEADMGIGVEALKRKLAGGESWKEGDEGQLAAAQQPQPSEQTVVEAIGPSASTTTMAVEVAVVDGPAAPAPLLEAAPAPVVVEMWTCPATGATMPMSERSEYVGE